MSPSSEAEVQRPDAELALYRSSGDLLAIPIPPTMSWLDCLTEAHLAPEAEVWLQGVLLVAFMRVETSTQ